MTWSDAWKGKPCATGCGRPAIHGHHIVYAQHVKRAGGDVKDARNALPLCFGCHHRHHSRMAVLPVSLIPAAAREFADELALGWFIDRYYQEAA